MKDQVLDEIAILIQRDVGNRGLRTDPVENLITSCPNDFQAACRSVAATPAPVIAVVTGFFIPHAHPPGGETDGPLGALFLARALVPAGIRMVLVTDEFCARALEAGLAACGLQKFVPVVVLPAHEEASAMGPEEYWQRFVDQSGPLTHLVALERVGPSHTAESVGARPGVRAVTAGEFGREVPAEHHDRCHTMRGLDITAAMSPAHWLFEAACRLATPITSIGIGDGGNEIGMGKLHWDVIRRNIPGGALVACRVPADLLIVCGVSNWGAYGLAAGVRALRGLPLEADLFYPDRERLLLQLMVERGPLVDGVTGRQTVSVDGLSIEQYMEPLRKIREMRVAST